jgi:aspartyl-tRNA(Asn)/glutamyl-tRNA(Gln) amidotransferase subunit B
VELAAKAALVLSSQIAETLSFDRKHYFYPDLPNGYQITQYFNPFARGGHLKYHHLGEILCTRLEQIQMEQDSAKSILMENGTRLLDFNRAGVAVLEIVTMPEIQ